MIAYALSGLALISKAFWSMRFWLAEHKWWRRIITILVIDIFLVVTSNVAVYAADGGSAGAAPFLPVTEIRDSSGIPISHYIVLPLDRGGAFDFGKAIVTAPLDFLWSIHLAVFAWMIWMCTWIISFDWLDLITVPFQEVADLAEQVFDRIHWIPFALTITAGVAGIMILTGKKVVSGWTELFMSAFLAFLAVGMLANPVATLTKAGGVLDTAREWGNSLAAAVATDDVNRVNFRTDDILTESVSMELTDMFVRLPAMSLTFGHALTGDCEAVFDVSMNTMPPVASDGDEVRDLVGLCDSEAKEYVEHPNFGQVITALLILPGGLVIFGFPIALMILFFSTAIKTLLDGLKTMWHVLMGVLPINRHALWKSMGGMFLGAATLLFLIVAMATALKVMVDFLTGLAKLDISIVAVMMIANFFLLVLVVMLVRAKIMAKRAGDTMAEHLSKLGLSGGGTSPRDGTKAIAMMSMASTVAAAALRRPDRTSNVDARSLSIGRNPASSSTDLGELTPVPASSGSGSGGGGSWPSAAGRAGKAASYALTAGRIAKGAAGGVPGVTGAAAAEAGSRVVSRVSSRAQRPVQGIGGEQMPTSTRIVVGENGEGQIVRAAPVRDGVADISSLPPARSARNEAFRARLEQSKN